ncbi:hypothetical protein [Leeuwenhoekiella parthenopeia]|uniref:Organic solvent tolerance-like N-terminal domain-containing protein n=1 Tax=Leeuwenhoekiella parthenopeia TaxID=2890320 RepID=A0ABS8GNG8_9FLAO|nr:hypothetical protein [Leeuwenhoekiella parthenopeia]MCC4211225.1 hypothetical protein [Leeuwenhoekiella parthenopeia]
MKNILLTFGLLIGFYSFGQKNEYIVSDKEEPSFSSETAKYDPENNTIEFRGNVNFQSEIIQLENADKILLNKNTNEIVVTGLKDFTIDGAIQIKGEAKRKILKYTLGDRIAYLE